MHIYVTNKKDLKKIDIGRCLATVQPPLWPGDIECDLFYAAETQPTPNSRRERALYMRALNNTKSSVFTNLTLIFTTRSPVVNLTQFDGFWYF